MPQLQFWQKWFQYNSGLSIPKTNNGRVFMTWLAGVEP